MMRGEWRNRAALWAANLILTRFTTTDLLITLYEVNRLGREEYLKKRSVRDGH